MSSTQFETIIYEKSGPVARLTMNRPDRLNGMTNRMLIETRRALAVAAEDRELRILVLTGSGKGFCPGADIGNVASAAPDEPLTVGYVALESERHVAMFRTEDTREAFAARAAKRKPQFKGR